jgi:L-lactate dehydrogenase
MKIGIVGTGMVGATAAYALVLLDVGRDIILIDQDRSRAEAEADDVRHAVPFAHPLDVSAGSYGDLAGARVVIIAAGVGQKPGETRLDLLGRNAAVFQDVIPQVLREAPGAVLLVATNPVDVMTHIAARQAARAGVPSTRVIGSGTSLDTARFRTLLGRHLGIDARHIHAYVVGEHGDSEVLAWSAVSVAGLPLAEFCRRYHCSVDGAARRDIDERVRKAAYRIIAGKRSTYYGVGAALARITSVILRDQRSILTLCTPMAQVAGVAGTTISLPHLVGGAGILKTIEPAVDEEEERALARSAQIIKEALDAMEPF